MLVLGHRGASASHPENTPEAFIGADDVGADGVELDVRIAPGNRNGQRLVVHHDPLPADHVELDALPTFEAVLDACGDRMLVNVEIKNNEHAAEFDPTMAVVAPVVHALRSRGPDWVNRVLISSFSPRTLDHCRRVGPEFATAQLSTGGYLDDGRALVPAAAAAGHAAIHPNHHHVTPDLVAEAHCSGLAVHVWTANDPGRIVELAAMGVDGVCTDVPDVALAALGRPVGEPEVTPRWASPS